MKPDPNSDVARVMLLVLFIGFLLTSAAVNSAPPATSRIEVDDASSVHVRAVAPPV